MTLAKLHNKTKAGVRYWCYLSTAQNERVFRRPFLCCCCTACLDWNSLPDALLLLLLLLKVVYFYTFGCRLLRHFQCLSNWPIFWTICYSLGWSTIGFPMKNFCGVQLRDVFADRLLFLSYNQQSRHQRNKIAVEINLKITEIACIERSFFTSRSYQNKTNSRTH